MGLLLLIAPRAHRFRCSSPKRRREVTRRQVFFIHSRSLPAAEAGKETFVSDSGFGS